MSEDDSEPMISSPDSSDNEGGDKDDFFKFPAVKFNKNTVVHSDSPAAGGRRCRRRKQRLSLEEQLENQEQRKQIKCQKINARLNRGTKKLFGRYDDSDDDASIDDGPHQPVISIDEDSPRYGSTKVGQRDTVDLLGSSDEEENYRYGDGCVNFASIESSMSTDAAQALQKSRRAALRLKQAQEYRADDIYVPVETPKEPQTRTFEAERAESPLKCPGKILRLICRGVVHLNGKKLPEKRTTLTMRENDKLQVLRDKFLGEHALPITAVVTMNFDGQALSDRRTAKSYDMADQDLIEVQAKSIVVSMEAVANKLGPKLKLTVRARDGKHVNEHSFMLSKQQRIQDLLDMYKVEAKPPKKFSFHFDGEILDPDKTPAAYDMENEDLIDAICR